MNTKKFKNIDLSIVFGITLDLNSSDYKQKTREGAIKKALKDADCLMINLINNFKRGKYDHFTGKNFRISDHNEPCPHCGFKIYF